MSVKDITLTPEAAMPRKWAQELSEKLSAIGVTVVQDNPYGGEQWPDERPKIEHLTHPTDWIVYIGSNPEAAMMGATLLLQAVQVVQEFVQIKRSGESSQTPTQSPKVTLRSRRSRIHIDLNQQTIDVDEVERELEQELSDSDD